MRTEVIHVRDAHKYDNVVYVGRRSSRVPAGVEQMTQFGNPFRMNGESDRGRVITAYRAHLLASPALLRELRSLRGKRLACWCAPKPCHADVLAHVLALVTDDELWAMASTLEAGRG